MCEVKYEDLPIIFQSDEAATDENIGISWHFIVLSHILNGGKIYDN